MLLEVADLLAHRAGGHEQFSGRLSEIQEARSCLESAERGERRSFMKRKRLQAARASSEG